MKPVTAGAFVTALGIVGCVTLGQGPPLRNPSFDEPSRTPQEIPGWTQLGRQFATAELVRDPVVSPPTSLRLTAIGPGSGGDDSFMLYQTLDHARYRGRRVRFGARARTDGGAVNIILHTPEKSANDFDANLHVSAFVRREVVLDVPASASYLSCAIQFFGPAGAKAWIDDAFLESEGGTAPAGAGTSPSAAASPATTPGAARVVIDATSAGRALSPLLFGMHLEWVDNGQGLLEAVRPVLRKDLLEPLKALTIPLFRFPGGIHADYYDWRLGTGPVDRRGRSVNIFTGKQEVHRFGTPEWLSLLSATGAEGLVTLNYGTGSVGAASEWAAYLKEAGAPVRYFEVGNEIHMSSPTSDGPNGRAIYRAPEQYAADFGRYRAAIRGVLPAAEVGAIAHVDAGAYDLAPQGNKDWTPRMLRRLNTKADFVAVHPAYAPVLQTDTDFSIPATRAAVYKSLFAAAAQTGESVGQLAQVIATLSPVNRETPFAITEFGPFFGLSQDAGTHAAYVDQTRTMAAALYVASVLDVMMADPRVTMACYTNPVHRWFGGLLTDTDAGVIRTPTYHLYGLYRSRFESTLLPTAVTSPTFDTPAVGIAKARRGVPDLVARAGISLNRERLAIMLVNRSLDRELATTVDLVRFAPALWDCMILSAPSPAAINGPSLSATTTSGTAVVPRSMACGAGNPVTLKIPPASVLSVLVRGRVTKSP